MSVFTDRLIEVVNSEWDFFGNSTISLNGHSQIATRETDPAASARIGKYWNFIGGVFSTLTGNDTDTPWSAAFISYCFNKAGSGNSFPYSASHSRYINISIKNSRASHAIQYPIVGHPVHQYSPQRGDLICYCRGESDISFDTATSMPYYTSHADVVVDVEPEFISVIGGNVSNSVTKKELPINSNGILVDNRYKWFCIIENKL